MHIAQIHLIGKALGDRLVEGVADVAQVLPYHLLAQTLPRDQEPCNCLSRVVQKAFSNQILDPTLWLLVENVQASPVVSFSDHFVDSVVGMEGRTVLWPAWDPRLSHPGLGLPGTRRILMLCLLTTSTASRHPRGRVCRGVA